MMTIGSLFSGIGGLELGLERSGLGLVVWQVEKDPYCRAVLARHWPSVERFEDVKEFHPSGPVDVLCGGFPCQPWSDAGRRRGVEDERHLWPEFARIIGESRPTWVIGENVLGLRSRGLRLVLADLAALGFDAEWSIISACSVGAPHMRRRVFIVAHASGFDGSARVRAFHGTSSPWPLQQVNDCQGSRVGWSKRVEASPGVPRGTNGPPSRVDRNRALGNAVVPQVAEVIGRAIVAAIGEH